MSVSVEEVRRVAELANLELTAEEEPRMQHDLNAVLGYIAQLSEVDTTGVEPMAQVGEMLDAAASTAANTAASAVDDLAGISLRNDVVLPSIDRRAVMASAPESDGRFFKVPKVIER